MKKKIIPLICGLILLGFFSCDSYEDEYIEIKKFPDYEWASAADSSSTSFMNRYWNTTNNCFNNTYDGQISWYDYWPEAHGLDVLIDAYLRTGEDKYKQTIYNFYNGVYKKNGNKWTNRYYDDMAWHGVTHLRAFVVTNDTRFEASAKLLWEAITRGWNDYDGGGIQWREVDPNESEKEKEASRSKGIPANGPACIIAARRYQMYPDEVVNGWNNLQWAENIYEWMKFNRTVLSSGRIFENFNDTNGDYSYDVGTFIGSALELYKITGNKIYLNDAVKVASYHMAANVNTNYRVMTDYGEQAGDNGGGHDCNLFKAIFVRYFTILIQHPDISDGDRRRFITFLKNNANYLWTYGTEKSPDIKFSYHWWETPQDTEVKWGDLRSAISGATAMEAMALLESKDFLK